MTRRRDIVKRIKQEARANGVAFDLARTRGDHDVYKLGGTIIPVPRHTDINELTTESIYKSCEEHFGKGWWRR